jgi:hypothetical protein
MKLIQRLLNWYQSKEMLCEKREKYDINQMPHYHKG